MLNPRNATENNEKLTFLIFKEGGFPRTCQVKLGALNRLGLWMTIGLFILLISIIYLGKRVWILRNASPARVVELEQRLSEITLAYENLKTNKTAPAPEKTAETPAMANPLLFPAEWQHQEKLPLSIQVEAFEARWVGADLKVQGNLTYTASDGGNQQGKILVLVHGQNVLQAHPAGIFGDEWGSVLIDPARGEPFSVSRFREIKASFGPFPDHKAVTEIILFITNNEGRLLLESRIKPQ